MSTDVTVWAGVSLTSVPITFVRGYEMKSLQAEEVAPSVLSVMNKC